MSRKHSSASSVSSKRSTSSVGSYGSNSSASSLEVNRSNSCRLVLRPNATRIGTEMIRVAGEDRRAVKLAQSVRYRLELISSEPLDGKILALKLGGLEISDAAFAELTQQWLLINPNRLPFEVFVGRVPFGHYGALKQLFIIGQGNVRLEKGKHIFQFPTSKAQS